MTDAELPPGLTRLTFHGPLSEVRAARIVARLTANRPRTVLDIGCGWGELMLRVLAAAPDATPTWCSVWEPAMRSPRSSRPGTPRPRCPSSGGWSTRAGGAFGDLASLTDLAVSAGFRPAWIETATLEEWEEFESGYQCDEEEWLAAHPGHRKAAEISERVDQHRSFWLRGYYGLLGQAYLTLVPAGKPGD